MADTSLRDLVFAAMDNAVENGYEQDMLCDPVEIVAIDLIDEDEDIEDLEPAVMDLIPFIEGWRISRAN